ncbi:MAG: DoxX family protein [Chitinophagaceae bacterium]
MKKLLSIRYSEWAFNVALLSLRLVFGIVMMVDHGIPKMMKFADLQSKFYDFLGLGSKWSLMLVIFSEVFCSLFLALGLFTRFALIPLVITMLVAYFVVHASDALPDKEPSLLYLTVYFAVLLVGPGKISVDGMIK